MKVCTESAGGGGGHYIKVCIGADSRGNNKVCIGPAGFGNYIKVCGEAASAETI